MKHVWLTKAICVELLASFAPTTKETIIFEQRQRTGELKEELKIVFNFLRTTITPTTKPTPHCCYYKIRGRGGNYTSTCYWGTTKTCFCTKTCGRKKVTTTYEHWRRVFPKTLWKGFVYFIIPRCQKLRTKTMMKHKNKAPVEEHVEKHVKK